MGILFGFEDEGWSFKMCESEGQKWCHTSVHSSLNTENKSTNYFQLRSSNIPHIHRVDITECVSA